MMHVIAFFDAIDGSRHDETEVQKNERNSHKSLRCGVHGVRDKFVEHNKDSLFMFTSLPGFRQMSSPEDVGLR